MPLQKGINRLRRHKHDGGDLSTLHLLQRHLVRNKHLFHIQTESAEDQRTGIGGGGTLGIEVDLLALEIRERPYFRANEDGNSEGNRLRM